MVLSPFFVTPAIFKPGSMVFKNLGALLDFRQRENHKGNKSRKKQRRTEEQKP